MERRTFLQSTLATGGVAAMAGVAMADDAKAKPGREFFELRLTR